MAGHDYITNRLREAAGKDQTAEVKSLLQEAARVIDARDRERVNKWRGALTVDDSKFSPLEVAGIAAQPGRIEKMPGPGIVYTIRLLAGGQDRTVMAFENEVDASAVAANLNETPREDEGTYHVSWLRVHKCVPEQYRKP
jgi:hypothetical protein